MAQDGGCSPSYYIQHSSQTGREGLEDKPDVHPSSCPSHLFNKQLSETHPMIC